MTNENLTPQDTRDRNAREEQTRDYATMPIAQLDHAFRSWGADVEVDADELASLRAEQQGLEKVRPAPFEQPTTDQSYHPAVSLGIYESHSDSLEAAGGRIECSMFFETHRPDWALDPHTELWTSITVTGQGSGGQEDVELTADHPEELHALATFLTIAANNLEKARATVTAVKTGDH